MTGGTQTIEVAPARRTRLTLSGVFVQRRSRRALLAFAAVMLAVSALLHIQFILTTAGAPFDMASYRIQAETVFRHENIYAVTTDRYPYAPVWIWIIALVYWIAQTLHLNFEQLSKVPASLADLGIAVLLLRYSVRRFGWCWLALVPMTLYALNPVAPLIGAGQGQFDALVLLFVLLATYLRGPRQNQHLVWGALALGVAIALKGYPVLALPYFVFSAPRGARIRTGIWALVPLVFSIVFYCLLFGFSSRMLTSVVNYRGTPDFGWQHVITAWPLPAALTSHLSQLLPAAIVLFAVVIPPLWFRDAPASAMTVLFAAFYALTFTMSVQYIVWILPFVCLAFPVWSLAYTVAALFATVTLYSIFYPHVIPTAIWPTLFSPFHMTQRHCALALIGVSACIVVYAIGIRSALSRRLRARLPGGAAHYLMRLQALDVDSTEDVADIE